MGVGEFLSSKATNEWILSEKRREEWELENYREGEIQEMVDIYVEKGMSYEDAKLVIETMAKYDDFFVDVMMQQELELQVPEENHVQESMKEGEYRNRLFYFGNSRVLFHIAWVAHDCFRCCHVLQLCFLWGDAVVGIRHYSHHLSRLGCRVAFQGCVYRYRTGPLFVRIYQEQLFVSIPLKEWVVCGLS
jgi:VIT family